MHKRILVCGSGGFIAAHLVKELKTRGQWVRGVDIKRNEFWDPGHDEFILGDMRNRNVVETVIDDSIDEVYQLCADMGGMDYVGTGDHDFDIMHNSALINLNVAKVCSLKDRKVKKIFFSSSACVYPECNQLDPQKPVCNENSAGYGPCDTEYGFEKLFSEHLYFSLMKNKGIQVKVARFHNIYGPYGTYVGGKEKAPAAMCRKASTAKNNFHIEVWGDGEQTRSFLYIDECIEAIMRFMMVDFEGPINIGSEEMVSINQLAQMAIELSGKQLSIKNVDVAHTGVRGRNSDNKLMREKLGWEPTMSLYEGMKKTYKWIEEQVRPSVSGSPNM